MLKKITLAMVLVSAGALPAVAQGAACAAPAAPAAVNGATATLDQMHAAVTAVKAFLAASDTYQDCLGTDIKTQKAAATKDKPFDPAIEAAADAQADANQKLKEQVGTAYNTAAADYKKAHPPAAAN